MSNTSTKVSDFGARIYRKARVSPACAYMSSLFADQNLPMESGFEVADHIIARGFFENAPDIVETIRKALRRRGFSNEFVKSVDIRSESNCAIVSDKANWMKGEIEKNLMESGGRRQLIKFVCECFDAVFEKDGTRKVYLPNPEQKKQMQMISAAKRNYNKKKREAGQHLPMFSFQIWVARKKAAGQWVD